MIMALSQDVNGQVTAAYFAAVLGLVSPEALDRLNGSGGGP